MSGHDPTMPVAGQINKAQVSGGGAIDADLVIANRSGDVLIKHTVLKADHFPSCHNTKLTPILEGAPNFRKVEGIQVYGVAIPTVAGLRQVVNTMMACNGVRKVYWQNLREEPLVFINGNPFVVREADQPFNNLEYTGIDRSRVEDMELRLKADILAEAAQFDNQILVMHENEDLSLYDHWEPVTAADVQTPQEVYAELKADGYDVDYLRVPITDEKAPKDEDFEELIHRLWAIPEDAGIIFNCQMGRGRTTTGMVIAALLWLRRMESFPVKKGKPETRASVPAWFRQAAGPLAARGVSPLAAKEGTLEGRLKAGNYGAVRSLLRALEKGNEAKVVLDAVIDACGAMQNLREGIASYRARFAKEAREKQRNLLLSVCLEYLERYYMLISFAGYLTSTAFDPGSPTHQSFPAWMAARPELRSILMRLLRRNSMAALELHQRSPSLGGGDMPSEGSERVDSDKDVVASRSGAVLGAFSILKEDNFPGMQSNKLAQSIEGAPNFRGLPSAPIFGVGMPTLDGITGVLQVVSGARSQGAGRRCSALWINMREEPVVYVNGRPFVLREESRPLKNMMEYAGIDAARLEAMEERLKKDVLAEALRHGGRILVAHESFEYGHYGELYDTWEEIDHPDAVATPAEVYSGLTRQGFAVKYVRIPVTDGTAPTLADFDSVIAAIMDFGLQNPVVFNCQMGIGRTTTGMVIASLIHMYTEGALQTARTLPQQLDDISWEDVSQLHGYLAAGMSPRSDNEEHDDDHHDAEDEKLVRVWDLEPEEAAEQKALAAGGYVGVRRVVRLLEEGEDAKRTLDAVVDSASDLLNLRVSIMKYRKPRSSYKFLRPELQQRGAAFKKGSAYLERYCLLLVFAYYLEHVGPEAVPFSAWVDSRPDLQAALNSLHLNPGAALAPLPLPKQPVVLADGEEGDLLRDQDKVLSKRKGRLLNKRTILKSYLFYEDDPALTAVQQKKKPKVPEAPDLKKAQEGLPIYSVGSLTASGLRAVMRWMGAAAGGPSHVCISDIREELVVYVNGTPYTRRELEMPAAALHHAGIHASQLEEQEALMKEDVQDEVASFSGRILLHKELNAQLAALISQASRLTLSGTSIPPTPSPTLTSTPTPPPPATSPSPPPPQPTTQATSGTLATPSDQGPEAATHPSSTPSPRTISPALPIPAAPTTTAAAPAGREASAAAAAAAAADNGSVNGSSSMLVGSSSHSSSKALEAGAQGPRGTSSMASSLSMNSLLLEGASKRGVDDVTALVDVNPGSQVAAFWESVDLEDPLALVTPRELVSQLIEEEGFQATYRRIPLSRERTPVPGDVDQLHSQLVEHVAAVPVHVDGSKPHIIHLILSRTSTGSSARFVAALLCTHHLKPVRAPSSLPTSAVASPTAVTPGATPFGAAGRASGSAGGASPAAAGAAAAVAAAAAAAAGGGSVSAGGAPQTPPSQTLTERLSSTSPGVGSALKNLSAAHGEYRGIMALCRLLPGGLEAKLTVDRAIRLVAPVGDLLDDIRTCKEAADAAPSTPMMSDPEAVLGASLAVTASRQLGLHYLKRYFLLVAYRCFLEQGGLQRKGFQDWMNTQRELGHLLHNLELVV